MKKQKPKKITVEEKLAGSSPEPTMFEQLLVINSALNEEMEIVPAEVSKKSEIVMPEWGRIIVKQLGKTVFKPILKLRPLGKVDWRNYGRMVTVMERYKTFISHDILRILEEEFANMTDEQWEKIEPRLGLDKLRIRLIQFLNRPVKDDEPLEKLCDEAQTKVFENLDRHKEIAFRHVAQQRPKIAALFFKGIAEGYELFVDERADFCGDRGRTDIHLNLLSCFIEVEKLRRTLPPTTRSQYYDRLAKVFKLPPKAYDWFNDVCDDINFPLNNLGRKRQASAPIL